MMDDEIIIKHEIKKFNLGDTKVKIIIPEMTVAQLRKCLTYIYYTINEIAEDCEKRGIDTSSWFYTDAEIEKMKNNPDYTFI